MADADQVLEQRVEKLLGLLSDSKACERLGDQFAGGVRQVVKKFEKEWPSPEVGTADIQALVAKSEKTLDLMADVRDLFRAAEQVYRVFLPTTLQFESSGSAPEKFSLEGLDPEGRPKYRFRGTPAPPPEKAHLRWSKAKQGGVWAVHTDADGKEPGDFQLNSPLMIDPGIWTHADGGAPAKDVRVTCIDEPVLEPEVAELLKHCWEGERKLPDVCKASVEVLEKSKLGSTTVSSGSTVLEVLVGLLEAMCNVVEKLEIGQPARPATATWSEFFKSLQSLASFANGKEPVWRQMAAKMPGFAPDYEITWVQCMVYMCRLLDISDMRLPSATWLLRLCNRCFLRSWQEQNTHMARLLDLNGKQFSIGDPRAQPKDPGALRCVAVSDTHGWDHDLRLPEGDVLFHCGDVLFHGAALDQDLDVPADLKEVLKVFRRPSYQRFKWIFLIGGNHDRSLHQLWAENPKRLCEELPPNMVLLQAPADLTPALSGSCMAKDSSVLQSAEDGALKLLPDMTLCRPSDSRPGWVIVGSGVSLANNAWSPNNAFQLIKDQAESLEKAAEVLGKHKPDVILTHGPPKGHCDSGRGDAKLAEAVAKCESVKVHLFGHVHETYGTDFSDGLAWVNASMSSPLYVPAAEPVVFDLAAVAAPAKTSTVTAEARGLAEKTKTLRLRGVPQTATALEVCQYFNGFMVATVLPPSAQALQGKSEARVFFEQSMAASSALDELCGKPFGNTAVELEPVGYDDVAKEAWDRKQWVTLYDVIPKAHPERITNKEHQAAIQMGILPKVRLHEGREPLFSLDPVHQPKELEKSTQAKAEEEDAKKAEEDAAKKAKAEEDAAKKAKAEEDAAKKAKAEEDAAKKAKAEEEDAKKAKAEEDAAKKAAEDAKAKADEDLRERRALSMRSPRVACGNYHSAALRGDGTVAQWGGSADHERDDFPSGAQFVAVACGYAHTVALRADGTLAQ